MSEPPTTHPSIATGANAAFARWGPDLVQEGWAYWIDACQRGLLFLDVLHQRGESYRAHAAKAAPHVLKFGCELIMDGRKLPRPVNYVLVRIVPPKGIEIDTHKRPFVIIDPRAGHGPGIGGFKSQSEIGVALNAGHPCYFIGFLPEPMPGQTIEDIAHAEAAFLERVIALHPQAEGKPAVIGNCQAGWAVMMLAAMRPELFGPIIVAGSPLSYWAGVHGQNPMRYTGGLLGGSWLTALMGDLGNGKFDGAWLVSNFENLNPANTLWTKHHNLYSKIDTEAPRYLEFEQWWGGHVLLNAAEMQFIVDELFVGNKLAAADIASADGSRLDLRNIRSPIVVFCSKADNITPPQQALDWILDLYDSVDDIRAHGQTIVYAVHELVGHLGIFVSGSVAKKEHDEFASNIDLIDVLPPGLYEAVMMPKDPEDASADLIGGNYLVRFEARTLDDIRALGGNDEEDDLKFAAAARVSEINLGLYRTFVQPWVRSWANEGFAKWMRQFHPLRLQYEMFSHTNPFMRPLLSCMGDVRENRQPVPKDNPFWQGRSNSGIGSRHRWMPIATYAITRSRCGSMRSTDRPWCRRSLVSRLRMRVRAASLARAPHTLLWSLNGSTSCEPIFPRAGRARLCCAPFSTYACRSASLTSAVSICFGVCGKRPARASRLRPSRDWCANSSSCCCSMSVAPWRPFPPCSLGTVISPLA